MGIGPIAPPLRRAVFLDRDGVLNRAVVRGGKPHSPAALADFVILPEAEEAVACLDRLGYVLCVVTNQPDVARGAQTRPVIEAMHAALRERLPLRHFYVCYHDDADGCACRKPKAGLLETAARDLNLSLPDSYMIGDRWRDIDCGHAAGCTTIFIDRGYDEALRREPHFRVSDALAAASLISSLKGEENVAYTGRRCS